MTTAILSKPPAESDDTSNSLVSALQIAAYQRGSDKAALSTEGLVSQRGQQNELETAGTGQLGTTRTLCSFSYYSRSDMDQAEV